MADEPDRTEFADDEGVQPIQDSELASREVVSTPYDASVRTLVDDIQRKELIVNPEFQRGSVWSRRLKSRLIESLLLNIPIPVLYFAEDDDGTRVVIDGQQRLRAISEFHSGGFVLTDLQVLSELNGKGWTDLSPKAARTIQNRTLRCVVISAKSSPTLRFEMFERLNTGFVQLNDQELRNSIYRGPFNELLEELANSVAWLGAMQRNEPNTRLQDHEMVLRFLALKHAIANYRPPLKVILNEFMGTHRRADAAVLDQFRHEFLAAVRNTTIVFGTRMFRRVGLDDGGQLRWDRAINRAVFDLQMLSLYSFEESVVTTHAADIAAAFQNLCLGDPEFTDAISRATADRARLYRRLRKWASALAPIGLVPSYVGELPGSD